jgi:hypothetical protein
MRQLIEGIRAVLGVHGLQATLLRAGLERLSDAPPPDDLAGDLTLKEYAALMLAVETVTGRARRSTMRRIGRVSFQWEQEYPPPIDPLAKVALKTLPTDLRRRLVLEAVAAGRHELVPGAQAAVERGEESWFYTDSRSPAAYERNSQEPVCDVYAGYLQQAMAWATGRSPESFQVTERACRASGGAACRFEIEDVID